MNMGGPSPKAKYDLVTDRVLVPRGNGEKNPGRGVKKNLKPYAYKQREHYFNVSSRTFCRTGRRVTLRGKVKRLSRGAEAKASLNRANSRVA